MGSAKELQLGFLSPCHRVPPAHHTRSLENFRGLYSTSRHFGSQTRPRSKKTTVVGVKMAALFSSKPEIGVRRGWEIILFFSAYTCTKDTTSSLQTIAVLKNGRNIAKC